MVYLIKPTATSAANASFYQADDAVEAFNLGTENLLASVQPAVAASYARGDAIDAILSQIRAVRTAA